MMGWVGDKPCCVQPHLFADADFAGCVLTQRSTSAVHLVIRGQHTSFPISGMSKRQGCVSHSTPEAEIVAAGYALRCCGIPCLDLWQTLLPHKPGLLFHEDNQAMIRVVETGRNPTMRYLHRTHRVSVGWLHERFGADDLDLVYELTTRMAADIYTKAFVDAGKWEAAQWLINIVDPGLLLRRLREAEEAAKKDGLATTDPPPQSGGTNRKQIPPKPSVPARGGEGSLAAAKPVTAGNITKGILLKEAEQKRILSLLRKVAWPVQARRHVRGGGGREKGCGTCLGATYEQRLPRL